MRIAVIGVGRIGTAHARALRQHPDVDEVLVADTDPDRARDVAQLLDVRAVPLADVLGQGSGGHGSSGQGSGGQGLDAVVVAAVTAAHAELVIRASESVPAVFCEKPISLDIPGTRKVLDHVEAVGTKLQIGFQRRFDAGYLAAHEAVRTGALGPVHTVRACTGDPAPPPTAYIPTSGGLYRDCLIHDFDAIRFVTGQEITEVFATGANVGGEVFARYGDVDTGVVILRLSGGALAVATGGRYNGAGYDVRMEVAGTRHTIAVGLDSRLPLRSVEPGPYFSPDLSAASSSAASSSATSSAAVPWGGFLERFADAYTAELAAFVDYARGRTPNPCSGQDALEALLVAEACELSRGAGRPVTLGEVR